MKKNNINQPTGWIKLNYDHFSNNAMFTYNMKMGLGPSNTDRILTNKRQAPSELEIAKPIVQIFTTCENPSSMKHITLNPFSSRTHAALYGKAININIDNGFSLRNRGPTMCFPQQLHHPIIYRCQLHRMLVHHICLLVGDLIITSLFQTPASSPAWHILLQHVKHL